MYLLMYSFIYIFIYSIIYLFHYLLIHLFVYLLMYSFIYIFMYHIYLSIIFASFYCFAQPLHHPILNGPLMQAEDFFWKDKSHKEIQQGSSQEL